jgi:hypothetical protein
MRTFAERRGVAVVAAGALALLAVACGGSDQGAGPPTGSGGAGGAGSGTLTWKEAGAAHNAMFAAAARVKSATSDMVQVTGADTAATAVSFGIVLMPPPLTAGAYSCSESASNGRIITMTYKPSGSSDVLVPTACTITISSIGDAAGTRVVGDFSATLPAASGPPKMITEGKFNIAQTVNAI